MLAAIESFGVEVALRRFSGMFAFGLWDGAARELQLGRDRLGKKPLYVAIARGALLFASEPRALRAFPGFRPEIDPAALAMVAHQGWVPETHCVWRGAFKVPPGTLLSVRAADLETATSESLRARARPWWSLAEVAGGGKREINPVDAESELDRLLRAAVRERMVADVPLGAFLSGGIDSSAVVALMQAQSSRPTRTFTIGFQEAGYDEATHAALVARHLGTDHTELRVTAAEAQAVIPDLPQVWDEPFADESQIPTLLVSRLARRHVTVALSGDGGDEGFGGYSRHFLAPHMESMLGLPAGLRRAACVPLRALRPDVLERIAGSMPWLHLRGDLLRKALRALDAGNEDELHARLTALGDTRPTSHRLAATGDSIPALPDLASRIMYRDTIGYLPGDILVKLDRSSMSVGLEGRCPLLDHRVIEFAWRLPTSLKLRDGKGKWLLRRVLRRYLPEPLFERPKAGFNVPIGAWLRGPLRDWAEDLLAASRRRDDGILDPARVQTIWREHLDGRRDQGSAVWAIVMIEAWLQTAHEPPAPTHAAALSIEGVR
jgi:asparagine synthase (glutamine-hydrolysing)